MKVLNALAATAFLAPVLVFQAAMAPAANAAAPCARVFITVSPERAQPAQWQEISVGVENCGRQAMSLKVVVHHRGRCDFASPDGFTVKLPPRVGYGIIQTGWAPSCYGGYVIGARATWHGATLDRTRNRFTVTPRP